MSRRFAEYFATQLTQVRPTVIASTAVRQPGANQRCSPSDAERVTVPLREKIGSVLECRGSSLRKCLTRRKRDSFIINKWRSDTTQHTNTCCAVWSVDRKSVV